MGESQSRYSIIERLTKAKLDIMTAKSELSEGLKKKEQYVDELKKDLVNWDKDVEEDVGRDKRKKERTIETAKQVYQNFSNRIVEKETVYDQKLVAIDDALKAIEEISKTSPT